MSKTDTGVWSLIDADNQVLGRLATQISTLLMGKGDNVAYAPNVMQNRFVVVINADKVKVTGNKSEQKVYVRHSGYLGGRKEIAYKLMQENHPTRIIEHAVHGMLPKNKLRARMMKRLKIYASPDHPHEAQLGTKADMK